MNFERVVNVFYVITILILAVLAGIVVGRFAAKRGQKPEPQRGQKTVFIDRARW